MQVSDCFSAETDSVACASANAEGKARHKTAHAAAAAVGERAVPDHTAMIDNICRP